VSASTAAMSHAAIRSPIRPVRVCVVGSTMVDLVTRVPRMPAIGETLAGHSFVVGHGGKGGNQAVMAAKLGAQVALVTRIGGDRFGDGALVNYREQGVDVRYVLQDPAHVTGVATILVDDTAQNCIVIVPGANGALSPDDVQAAAGAIAGADVVVAQLEVPVAAAIAAFRVARAAGVTTIFNPAPAAPVPDEIWRLSDVVVPNETEAAVLTGLPVEDDAQAETAARALIERGARAVILTLGRRGSLVVNVAGTERILPVAVDAVDSTGAGDAYVGTLAVTLGAGLSLFDAASRANLIAALSVTNAGTQTSFPELTAAEEFLARFGLPLFPAKNDHEVVAFLAGNAKDVRA
jgi:ribokinase